MILRKGDGPTGKRHEGKCIKSHYRQMIHAPNGMQLTSKTPNMQCNKRILITDGGMKIPTLTERTCMGCHVSLFQPLALKLIQYKLISIHF